MAETTAEKAVEWLTSDKAFGQECYSRKQISALIEQQAATIDKKNAEINTLTQANAEMVLRLTIDAMRNLTSEQIDDVCQRIIAGQVKEG